MFMCHGCFWVGEEEDADYDEKADELVCPVCGGELEEV